MEMFRAINSVVCEFCSLEGPKTFSTNREKTEKQAKCTRHSQIQPENSLLKTQLKLVKSWRGKIKIKWKKIVFSLFLGSEISDCEDPDGWGETWPELKIDTEKFSWNSPTSNAPRQWRKLANESFLASKTPHKTLNKFQFRIDDGYFSTLRPFSLHPKAIFSIKRSLNLVQMSIRQNWKVKSLMIFPI